LWVHLQPVITGLLAIPLLGEHPSPRLIPAAILIFAGVIITERGARRARAAQPPSAADQTFVEV
jgi:drug/metabolite transporter (DMT)-like permease